MKRKFVFGVVTLLVLCIMGTGYWWYRSKSTASVERKTAVAEKGTLIVSVTSSGQVTDMNSRAVTTNVSGVVKTVWAQNGSVVQAGSKLLEVELDQEGKQAYTQALSSYQSAQNAVAVAQASLYSQQATMLSKWDSFKELSESDTYKDSSSANRALPEFMIPEREWLAAEAQFKNQQSVVNQAKTALSSARQSLQLVSPVITAPLTGEVSGLSLAKGMVLTSSTGSTTTGVTVAHLTTTALPSVSVELSESDVTKVKLGDKVTITLDALPEKTYTGVVASINTVGSVSSGVTSYPVVIHLDTAAPEIYSNMSVQANIITDIRDHVLLIPASAVKSQNGISTVRIWKDNQEQTVSVELGARSGTQVEVLSGLSEGDTVVISSATTTSSTKTSAQATSPFSSVGGGALRMIR